MYTGNITANETEALKTSIASLKNLNTLNITLAQKSGHQSILSGVSQLGLLENLVNPSQL